MELGDADDQVFARIHTKHGSGTVGVIRNGFIDRSKYHDHALILALVPWIRCLSNRTCLRCNGQTGSFFALRFEDAKCEPGQTIHNANVILESKGNPTII